MTLPELVEDWLRDMVVSALALLSLLGVLGAALSAGGPAWTVLGVLGEVADEFATRRAALALAT